jgi:hypothetical protein
LGNWLIDPWAKVYMDMPDLYDIRTDQKEIENIYGDPDTWEVLKGQ